MNTVNLTVNGKSVTVAPGAGSACRGALIGSAPAAGARASRSPAAAVLTAHATIAGTRP